MTQHYTTISMQAKRETARRIGLTKVSREAVEESMFGRLEICSQDLQSGQ